MSSDDIVGLLLKMILVALMIGVITIILIAPYPDEPGRIKVSQSFAQPEFVQWTSNNNYRVMSVSVWTDGDVVIKITKDSEK